MRGSHGHGMARSLRNAAFGAAGVAAVTTIWLVMHTTTTTHTPPAAPHRPTPPPPLPPGPLPTCFNPARIHTLAHGALLAPLLAPPRHHPTAPSPAARVAASLHTGSQGFGVQFATYVAALAAALALPDGPGSLAFTGAAWNYGPDGFNLRDDVLLPIAPLPASRTLRHAVFVSKASICDPSPAAADPWCEGDVDAGAQARRKKAKRSGPVMVGMGGGTGAREWGVVQHAAVLAAGKAVFPLSTREWEGVLTAALFCLRPRFAQLGLSVRAESGFVWGVGKVVGLHVRRGDRTELHGLSLEQYYAPLRRAAADLGTRMVYVAADSRATLEEVASDLADEFSVYSLATWADATGSSAVAWGAEYQFSESSPTALLSALLVDLDVLGSCAVLVGAQRSMFAWTASRLIIGRGNEVACPAWVGGDTTNAYGWWSGESVDPYRVCV